jgi:hypothetical protein
MRSFSYAAMAGTAAVSKKLSDTSGYAIVVTDVVPEQRVKDSLRECGGYHPGVGAVTGAEYVCKYLARYLEHNFRHMQNEQATALSDEDMVRVLMTRACDRCQAEVLAQRDSPQFQRDGVRCGLLMWVGRRAWVGVVGDAGAFLRAAGDSAHAVGAVSASLSAEWVAAEKLRIAQAGGYSTTGDMGAILVFGSVPTTRAIGYRFQINLLEWLEPAWKKVSRARSGSEVLSIMSAARLNLPIEARPVITEVLLPESGCSLMITSSSTSADGRAEALLNAVASLDRKRVEELADFSFAGIGFHATAYPAPAPAAPAPAAAAAAPDAPATLSEEGKTRTKSHLERRGGLRELCREWPSGARSGRHL